MTPQSENQNFINLITNQTENLLVNHWSDIQDCRGSQSDFKISFTHSISTEGSFRSVKSQISFAHRFSDTIEDSFDSNQTVLPFAQK